MMPAALKNNVRSIVFVHLGTKPPRRCLFDAIDHAITFDKYSDIFLITERHLLAGILSDFPTLLEVNRFRFVFSDELPRSLYHQQFSEKRHHDHWRHDFWLLTTERFLYIHDLILYLSLENVLHLESDVLIYDDVLSILLSQPETKDVLFPLDRTRGIGSVVYFSRPAASECLCRHILSSTALNDMALLNEFYSLPQSVAVGALPTLPKGLVRKRGLDSNRFAPEGNVGNYIFDAAALGQFLGGIDPIHDSGRTFGFVNEEAPVDPTDLRLSWGIESGKKYFFVPDETCSKVLNLHVHSKATYRFRYDSHNVPSSQDEIITGDRIMALCDVVLTTREKIAYHKFDVDFFGGRFVVLDDYMLPGGKGVRGEVFSDLDKASGPLFVYGDLYRFFVDHIAPNLEKRHVVLVHNSDVEVDNSYDSIFDNPSIVRVFAQNATSLHPLLEGVPIGLANAMFAHGDLSKFFDRVQSIRKRRMVWAGGLSLTHGSRSTLVDSMKQAPDLFDLNNGRLEFSDYVEKLCESRFVVCPRGNGVDTHRIWETIYSGGVPVVTKAELHKAFPVNSSIILDGWRKLQESLSKAVAFPGSNRPFEGYTMTNIRSKILDA